MNVTVLGCGPAGLLAATAAKQLGAEVRVISRKEPSIIHGAQYLHEHIPGVTEEDDAERVTFAKVGEREGYAAKVYGHEDAPTSWDIFGIGEYPAWPMKETYERLWALWYREIEDHLVTSADIEWIVAESDLTLCSIPADRLCGRGKHTFKKARIRTAPVPLLNVRNLVVYNGREDEPWYRASNLFGHHSVELPYVEESPAAEFVPDLIETGGQTFPIRFGIKPIETTCDCHQGPGFRRIGRFGKWSKGALVGHAYKDARQAMEDAGVTA